MHHQGFPERLAAETCSGAVELPNVGDYHYRAVADAEVHLNDPAAISKLQEAAKTNSVKAFQEYSKLMHDLR